MKKYFIIIVLLVGLLCKSFAQPIPSSCLPPWPLQQYYDHDVKNLAVKYMRSIHSPDTVYVNIPQSQQDSVMEGLAAIFNCGHPGRDSIFDMYCVHDLAYQPVTPGFIITVSTNAPWLSNWQNLQTLTGVPALDSLLIKYDLQITNWFNFISAGVFSTTKLLNPYALEDSLQWASQYITALEPNFIIGAAGAIDYTKTGDTRDYTFYFQWNDCFDGCDNWHFWNYSVNADCSVEYLGTGDWGVFGIEPLPAPLNCNITTGINNPSMGKYDLTLFPNPSRDKLYLQLPEIVQSSCICEIYSSSGQLLLKEDLQAKSNFTIDISVFPIDYYIIRIQYGERVYTSRFIKE